MKLKHGNDFGYCTNIHRGETWEETFRSLKEDTLRVRERVAPKEAYGIGLRLGHGAAVELSSGKKLAEFRNWLEMNDCYVFTINGFPYGQFHGTRVKEQVYRPDWLTTERLDYTNLLFDLLVEMLPEGGEGSVSTLPGSFKEFGVDADGMGVIFDQLKKSSEHMERLMEKTGKTLHLGLEPEPLGLFETSWETVQFFAHLVDRHGMEILKTVGVNYDTCHLAVEFEEPEEALERITGAGIRISKLHLSSALKLVPSAENLQRLRSFEDDVYLHQVVVQDEGDFPLRRYRDLAPALEMADSGQPVGDEWRVHFHVPLHAGPEGGFETTRDHLEGALGWLKANPDACPHLEMETYTWEVLPADLREGDVVDQLVREYEWCFNALDSHELR